jgi:hypothetical protein
MSARKFESVCGEKGTLKVTVEARQLGTDFGYPHRRGRSDRKRGLAAAPAPAPVGSGLEHRSTLQARRLFVASPHHGLRDGRGTKNLWSALETKSGFSNFCVATRKVASGA